MSIIGSLPYTLTAGTPAVAPQVMSDLNQIITDVNANAIEGPYVVFSGPATTIKTYTLPNVTCTILTTGATANLTLGFTVTSHNSGTKSSGTYTPDPTLGNMQRIINGGAHTLAAPSNECTMVIQYTNNASAGAITTSGFTKVSGAFTTTNGDDFMCYITKCNGFSHLNIVALQ